MKQLTSYSTLGTWLVCLWARPVSTCVVSGTICFCHDLAVLTDNVWKNILPRVPIKPELVGQVWEFAYWTGHPVL